MVNKKRVGMMVAVTLLTGVLLFCSVFFLVRRANREITQRSFDELATATRQIAKDLVDAANADQTILSAMAELIAGHDERDNDAVLRIMFYPQEFLDEAQRRGIIADKDTEMRKGKRFMTFFCLVILIVLIAVIAGWNGVKDFKTASFETYLFLVVVNWFDGFVIDLLWVGHSKIWRIEGMEGVPYGKPWRTVYTKRSAATALYLLVAAAVGGIVVLIGKI